MTLDDDPWLTTPGPGGAAPLEDDEVVGLIPSWIVTRGDLNAAEQANMLAGLSLPRWRRASVEYLLDDLAARRLHEDLFRGVWAWAGTYRNTERNIGVDPSKVSVCVRDLMEDTKAWLEGPAPMAADTAGYRFHHRLVQIHPFPNGNGRHARAMTDLFPARPWSAAVHLGRREAIRWRLAVRHG